MTSLVEQDIARTRARSPQFDQLMREAEQRAEFKKAHVYIRQYWPQSFVRKDADGWKLWAGRPKHHLLGQGETIRAAYQNAEKSLRDWCRENGR